MEDPYDYDKFIEVFDEQLLSTSDSELSSPVPEMTISTKKQKIEREKLDILKKIADRPFRPAPPPPPVNDIDQLFASIATVVKKFDPKKQIEARHRFYDLLRTMEMEILNNINTDPLYL